MNLVPTLNFLKNKLLSRAKIWGAGAEAASVFLGFGGSFRW